MQAVHRRTPSLLWTALFVVTTVALVLLVVVLGHWWPDDNAWYLPAAVAWLLLVTAGAVWAVSSIYFSWKHRRGEWWMLVWPVLTALGVAVALTARPDFDDARPEFEAIARELLAAPGGLDRYDLEIGRVDIGMAFSTVQGDVFFTDARVWLLTSESGWVYSPDGVPAWPNRAGQFTSDHLDGPWYRYTRVMNF